MRSSRIRDGTHVSCIVSWIPYHWATREAFIVTIVTLFPSLPLMALLATRFPPKFHRFQVHLLPFRCRLPIIIPIVVFLPWTSFNSSLLLCFLTLMPLSLNFLETLLGLLGFVGRPHIQPHFSLYSLQKFYCTVVGRIYKNISSLIPCDPKGFGFSNSEWLEFVDLHCFLSFLLVNCPTELISFLEHFFKCGPYHLELFQFTFPPWAVSLIKHTACSQLS